MGSPGFERNRSLETPATENALSTLLVIWLANESFSREWVEVCFRISEVSMTLARSN